MCVGGREEAGRRPGGGREGAGSRVPCAGGSELFEHPAEVGHHLRAECALQEAGPWKRRPHEECCAERPAARRRQALEERAEGRRCKTVKPAFREPTAHPEGKPEVHAAAHEVEKQNGTEQAEAQAFHHAEKAEVCGALFAAESVQVKHAGAQQKREPEGRDEPAW